MDCQTLQYIECIIVDSMSQWHHIVSACTHHVRGFVIADKCWCYLQILTDKYYTLGILKITLLEHMLWQKPQKQVICMTKSMPCWYLLFIEPLIEPYSMYSVGSLEARVRTQGKYVHPRLWVQSEKMQNLHILAHANYL